LKILNTCYSRRLFFPFALCILPLVFTCGYSVDPQQRDVLEIERVWQYMKAYSLYSAQAPSREQALATGTPVALVESIPDTLHNPYSHKSDRYGTYSYGCGGSGKQAADKSAQKEWLDSYQQAGTVVYFQLTPVTAYLRIDSFSVATADSLHRFGPVLAAVPNIIIDLLMNPGGSLDACTASVELFLPAGTHYLNTTYRKDPGYTGDTGLVSMEPWIASRTGDGFEGKRIIFLASRNSASASEILISALRNTLDNCRVIGDTTYGKAIGQYSFCFWRTSDARLTLTGFRFFPVSGTAYDYHEKGIIPDALLADTNWWMHVAAAGEALEPGFSAQVDTAVISYFNKSYLSKEALEKKSGRAYCTKELAERDIPLF
jgi:hypothetical protein